MDHRAIKSVFRILVFALLVFVIFVIVTYKYTPQCESLGNSAAVFRESTLLTLTDFTKGLPPEDSVTPTPLDFNLSLFHGAHKDPSQI